MKFHTPGNSVPFKIPDDWWTFTEMATFSPGSDYYPYKEQSESPVVLVHMSQIEPPKRNSGVPRFRKYKLVPILLAFKSPECHLPPVEVAPLVPAGSYSYGVVNGYHRFYTAAAAGYKLLPTVQRR